MNKLLLINKPKNMTSFDVVNKVKKITGLKVGHCGTLDPNATGLMVLLLGSATKLLDYLDVNIKEYKAKAQLGLLTDTLDIWGEVLETKEIVPFSQTQLKEVCLSFLGESEQQTPIVSAVKVKGKRLYQYHRLKQEVELPMRRINVYAIDDIGLEKDIYWFKVQVSKGTYIRQLSIDIAAKLNNLSTLIELERTKMGCFSIEEAIELEQLSCWQDFVIDPLFGLKHLQWIEVDDALPFIQGKKIELDCDKEQVLIVNKNQPIAIYRKMEGNLYRSERGIW